ncbi:hypothetical protein [Anaerosporobacter sp.]
MLFGICVVASSTIVENIITGCGLGVGIYCASRSGKNTYMPKKAK